VDIQTEEFVQQLRPFLLEKTQHFVHELLNFMRSPFDMIGFDEAVQYDWPPHLVCVGV
jgi:E3 ubiquitin-protein ligase Topors